MVYMKLVSSCPMPDKWYHRCRIDSAHNLTQLVNVPTHKCGHILDWVVVRTENSCFCFDSVQDYPDLSDHKAVVCTLAVTKPSPRRRLVTSRNIKAICLSDFQSDVRAWVEAASQQCSDLDLASLVVDVYNDGLCRVLDRHTPSVTRCVRDRPSAPWMTEEIREARRRRTLAERQGNLRQGAGCCEGVCSGGQETVLLWEDRLQFFLQAALCCVQRTVGQVQHRPSPIRHPPFRSAWSVLWLFLQQDWPYPWRPGLALMWATDLCHFWWSTALSVWTGDWRTNTWTHLKVTDEKLHVWSYPYFPYQTVPWCPCFVDHVYC